MNSRDADYEENLARALAESGAYRRKDDRDKDSVDSGNFPKRRKKDSSTEDDANEAQESSRSRENNEPESKPSSNVGKYRSGRGRVQEIEVEAPPSNAGVKVENSQPDANEQQKQIVDSSPSNDDESSATLDRITDTPVTSSRSRSRKRQKTGSQNNDDDTGDIENRKPSDESDSKSKAGMRYPHFILLLLHYHLILLFHFSSN